jgi:RNA polymerase sigma-70 factor (ECF subfamily)
VPTGSTTGSLPTPEVGIAQPKPFLELEELVAPAAAGDRASVSRLLAMLQPMVVRYCRARIGRQETAMGSADDVAQEVCLAVLSALPGYRAEGGSFRAFVYGIAAHKVSDAFRAASRNRSEPVAEVPDVAEVARTPEQQALMSEMSTQIAALLATLTIQQREVLVLRLAVGMSAEETAQSVSSSAGAVRVIQHRALTKLRAMLGDPQR